MLEFAAVAQNSGKGNPLRLLDESQIAGLTAQSGCLVVGIVLAALVAGIWLDRILGTRPTLTLALVLGSMPVSLFLMFRIAMRVMGRKGKDAMPNGKGRNDFDPQA
ncbi:MAG: AtpZ/AtpI family protein [Anaerolineales bacterium]|nr:AtpZ/AtpI family protein [Anaerolineales bacterium]